MRATRIDHKREGRPVVLVRLQQVAKLRRQYIAQIPRWRQPLMGYFFSFPFVAIALIFALFLKMMLTDFYFPGALMLLAIVLVAFIWGVGPALLSVILSTVALDYFFIPSSEQLSLQSWDGVAQILHLFSWLVLSLLLSQDNVKLPAGARSLLNRPSRNVPMNLK